MNILIINAIRHTFTCHERLKREQHIETLFRTGKAFSAFPLRVVTHSIPRAADELSPVRIGFSVPKKKWKHAADRNRLKRLMREAWRLQKHEIYASIPTDIQWHIFLIFTDTTLPKFEAVQQTMAKVISKLQTQVSPQQHA